MPASTKRRLGGNVRRWRGSQEAWPERLRRVWCQPVVEPASRLPRCTDGADYCNSAADSALANHTRRVSPGADVLGCTWATSAPSVPHFPDNRTITTTPWMSSPGASCRELSARCARAVAAVAGLDTSWPSSADDLTKHAQQVLAHDLTHIRLGVAARQQASRDVGPPISLFQPSEPALAR